MEDLVRGGLAAAGSPFTDGFVSGTTWRGEIAFYPGAYPLRAVVRSRLGGGDSLEGLPGHETVEAFLDHTSESAALQPWLERLPAALRGVQPLLDGGPEGRRWLVRDRAGQALPLVGGGHWALLSMSGGRPVDLAAEWDGEGLIPLVATSVVYSGIFGAVLASIRAVNTRMVVYDTSVADLTEDLQDPVDFLFGTQLGGGNDTPRALAYCQSIITRPAERVMVLVTDCCEGGLSEAMPERAARIVDSGVTMVYLLALGDDGAPTYDRRQAAAIQKQDLDLWAARNEIVTARGS